MGGCNDDNNGMTQRARVSRVGSVYLVQLCQSLQVTATRASPSWDKRVISGKEIAQMGPMTLDMVGHMDIQDRTTNWGGKMVIERRAPDGSWLGPSADLTDHDLVGLQQGNGYAIGAPFTDRGKFGLEIRVVLYTRVMSGTATESANVSAWLALRPLCC